MIDKKITNSIIQTFTGRYIDPIDPNPDDIDIKDIAHALSNACRYGGHVLKFYSVAEHSILLSKLVSKEYALSALLHDASEAYLVDMPRPIKYAMPEYLAIEHRLMEVISKKFQLTWPLPEHIHDLDVGICGDEMAQNMRNPSSKYIPIGGIKLHCWSPKTAERRFLARYREITGTQTLFEKAASKVIESVKTLFSMSWATS